MLACALKTKVSFALTFIRTIVFTSSILASTETSKLKTWHKLYYHHSLDDKQAVRFHVALITNMGHTEDKHCKECNKDEKVKKDMWNYILYSNNIFKGNIEVTTINSASVPFTVCPKSG